MIRGRVNAAHEPVVALWVHGTTDALRLVEATVDTGFNGFLTLPRGLILGLALERAGVATAKLADGRSVETTAWLARIDWHFGPAKIVVHESGDQILAGMALLYGSRLTVEAIEDGVVEIEPLV